MEKRKPAHAIYNAYNEQTLRIQFTCDNTIYRMVFKAIKEHNNQSSK